MSRRGGAPRGAEAAGRLPAPSRRVSWRREALRRVWPGLALVSCGRQPSVVAAPEGPAALVAEADGGVSYGPREGALVLRGSRGSALVEVAGLSREVTSTSCGLPAEPAERGLPGFGRVRGFTTRCTASGVTLEHGMWLLPDGQSGVATLAVENGGGEELRVRRLAPLEVGPGGGLFVGADAARTRVLDDGANVVLDVEARVHHPESTNRQLFLDDLLAPAPRGALLSNWNVGIADLDSPASFVAGALTVERGFPTVGVGFDPSAPALDAGRRGFASLHTDQALLFRGKRLRPGERLDAEPVWFDAFSRDARVALERYADAIATHQGIRPWTATRPRPNGWNSWTGSAFTGGLGTDIDERVMLENLEVMAREFAPFGVDWFQIDDGYQRADGDWVEDPARFPGGMPALATRIERAGLQPGIWISAFRASQRSDLFAAHPEWFQEPSANVLGPLLDPGSGARILDLSHPEALQWLEETFRRYREAWRMRWVKLDFAYYALAFQPRYDPEQTAVEAYRAGLLAARRGLGDGFLLSIALMGFGWGIADGMRLTLDDGPTWEEAQPFALVGQGGSLKSTVKTGAKRWYFNDRVWVSHDDLLFFRSNPETPEAPLSRTEARTFASFIGLAGSIVKFGEDLRTLTPEQIRDWRKLLPGYPRGGRPLDVFTRLYPEVWELPVQTESGALSWHVVGLLHWGKNWDLTAEAPVELGEAPRRHELELGALGLDAARGVLVTELWSDRFLGRARGTLAREVGAREGQVLALWPDQGRPQCVGHSRHWTQGATELEGERFDATEGALTVALRVDRGPDGAVAEPLSLRFVVPPPWRAIGASLGQVTEEGELVRVALPDDAEGRVEVTLRFERR